MLEMRGLPLEELIQGYLNQPGFPRKERHEANFLGNTLFGYEFLEKEKWGKIKRETRREGKPQLCKKHKWPVTRDFSGKAVWNCFNLQLSDGRKEK